MAESKKTPTKKVAVVKSVEELEKELAAKQQDLIQAKQSHKAGELVNPRVLGETRREIARLKTAIRAEDKKEAK